MRTQTGRKREGERDRKTRTKKEQKKERQEDRERAAVGGQPLLSSTCELELEAPWQKQRPDKEAVAAAMLPFSGLSLPESNLSCFFLHPQPSRSEPDLVTELSATHRRVNTTG